MLTQEHLTIRDRFRALYPDVVSIGFRFTKNEGCPIMHVLYWKDQEFPSEFEGIPVVVQKSGPGILC